MHSSIQPGFRTGKHQSRDRNWSVALPNYIETASEWTVKALLVFAVALLVGCASSEREQAVDSGWADAGSTAVGIASGAAEANPLGIAALLIKPAALAYADELPQEDRAQAYAMISALWGGASANNLCVVAVMVSGAVPLAPACLMVGLAWGQVEWGRTAIDRELWALCKAERAYWGNPEMRCDFIKDAAKATLLAKSSGGGQATDSARAANSSPAATTGAQGARGLHAHSTYASRGEPVATAALAWGRPVH